MWIWVLVLFGAGSMEPFPEVGAYEQGFYETMQWSDEWELEYPEDE